MGRCVRRHPVCRDHDRLLAADDSAGALAGRCGQPRDGSRPLAANRAQLEGLYDARRLAYAQAHVRLDASRASVGDLADQVLEWLGA